MAFASTHFGKANAPRKEQPSGTQQSMYLRKLLEKEM
jgi:hypothetical protein